MTGTAGVRDPVYDLLFLTNVTSASLFPKEPIFPGTQCFLMEYYKSGIHKTKKMKRHRYNPL